MGAPRRGSPPLLSFLPRRRLRGEEACPLRWARGCRPGPGAEPLRAPPPRQGFEVAAPRDAGARPLLALPLLSSRPRGGPAGSEVTAGAGPLPQEGLTASRSGPGRPGTRRGSRWWGAGLRRSLTTGPGQVDNLAAWVTCPPLVLAGVNYVRAHRRRCSGNAGPLPSRPRPAANSSRLPPPAAVGRLQTPPAARPPPTAPHPRAIWAWRSEYSGPSSPRPRGPGPSNWPRPSPAPRLHPLGPTILLQA